MMMSQYGTRRSKLVTTIGQYLLRTMQYTFLACQVIQSL